MFKRCYFSKKLSSDLLNLLLLLLFFFVVLKPIFEKINLENNLKNFEIEMVGLRRQILKCVTSFEVISRYN